MDMIHGTVYHLLPIPPARVQQKLQLTIAMSRGRHVCIPGHDPGTALHGNTSVTCATVVTRAQEEALKGRAL